MLRKLAPLALIAALWLMSFGIGVPSASAHANTSIAYSDIQVDQGVIRYSLQLDMYDLRVSITPDDPEIGTWTEETLAPFIKNEKKAVADYLLSGIKLYADSIPLDGKLTDLKLDMTQDQPFADATLEFPLLMQPEHLILAYNIVFDDRDQFHNNFVNLTMNDKKQTTVLTYETREIELGKLTFWRAVEQYFILGIEHLLTGYDHILFLIGLLIGARSVKQILMVVTSFTAAHTITLLLSSLGVIQLPGKIVEPIIALSIIYVALTSLFRKEGATKHNVWLAFGFGLIHGFGFAGTLSEMRLDTRQFFSSLLTFNVGIETAQVLLVLLLFPLIRYARRWKPSMATIASCISLFGFIWFVQRVFF